MKQLNPPQMRVTRTPPQPKKVTVKRKRRRLPQTAKKKVIVNFKFETAKLNILVVLP